MKLIADNPEEDKVTIFVPQDDLTEQEKFDVSIGKCILMLMCHI